MSADSSERALILAPNGRDAPVACAMLTEAHIAAEICADLNSLVAALESGAGFAIVAEEALRGSDLGGLAGWIESQPQWSDFPFVLLTHRGGGLERNPAATRYLNILGNVTFLERPFHPTTLISVAQSALRGRRRQYEARARLLELNLFASDLEQKVEERSRQHAAALAQLHEAQKLETLGQLTGGVAHDFNNLLMAISGSLAMLEKRIPADPQASRLIENAQQGAQRGAALTQRMLAFARKQDLVHERVNLAALTLDFVDLMQRTLGAEWPIAVRIPDDLPAVLADRNQLEMALLNLAVNARDATPGGGRIEIFAEHKTVDDANAYDLANGSYIGLCVSDHGIGMDAQTLQRAMEPFFTTKGVGKGTGLGLSMVHGLAKQLNGTFVLESIQGKGTSACLWLPTVGGAEERKAAVPEPDPVSVPHLRVLAVDDDLLIRMSVVSMLEDMGHTVYEADSGAEALSLLKETRDIELLITDQAMPNMTGTELIRTLERQKSTLPVILATGYGELPTDTATQVIKLGKPFTQAELAKAVERATMVRH